MCVCVCGGGGGGSCKVGKVCQKRSFLAVFSRIWSKTPSNKTVCHNSTSFLLLIDSPNGLRKFKVVKSTVSQNHGGGGGGVWSAQPPFVDGVGTKYLRT